jgi:hypothetical protein
MANFAPRPDPYPCHNNCGAVYVDGAKKEEITCPCGFGYYDRNGEFVPGSLVRAGKKPTRAEYVAHVEACDQQERGRPILAERQSGGFVYQGARDTGPMREQKPGTEQSRTTAGTAQDASVKEPGGKDYFLPSESIRQDVLQRQLKSMFGPTATARPSTHNVSPVREHFTRA